MAIEAVVTPNPENNPPEVVHFGEFFYYHDIVANSLVIAKNLIDNTGAAVYSAKNVNLKPEEIGPITIFDLANRQNFYKTILPFMRDFIPVSLDDGTEGLLSLRQYPSAIPVTAYRAAASQE